MKRGLLLLAAATLLAVGGTTAIGLFGSSNELCAAPATVSFADDVVPIFKGYCFACHQPPGQGTEKSGLDLSTYDGVMNGTKFGKMVLPGDPDSSNLMWLLDWRGAPETHMPLGKKQLSSCARTTVRTWIIEGATNN
jgi:hypothetical protein